MTLLTESIDPAAVQQPPALPLTEDQIREREVECLMPGRSRLACWGCPAGDCRFNEQPFEDPSDTVLIAERAAALLRDNRV